MQTGPAPKQSLDTWLVWTGILEFVSAILFVLVWWTANLAIPGGSELFSILGIVALTVVLLQGGAYWLLVRARFFQKTPARVRLRLLRAQYGLSIALLLAFPGLLLWRIVFRLPVDLPDTLLGAGFYLFGLGEFLHYFVFKINMRPYELKNALRGGQLVPARILRELRRARYEVKTLLE